MARSRSAERSISNGLFLDFESVEASDANANADNDEDEKIAAQLRDNLPSDSSLMKSFRRRARAMRQKDLLAVRGHQKWKRS